MGWYGNSWGWGSGLGMVMMLLVWGGLIALGIWGVARLTRGGNEPTLSVDVPRQVLDRRFAAGEIDPEQYAEARRVLDSGLATGASPHQ
ncbi:MAG: SHOCT domain-containing protein [Actinomycetes bacterium]